MSYVGDAQIGKLVNIGAGTITCNYDGVNKNKTRIKDKVFIGSNSSLVAPITINKDSIVGAGSVITKNVKKAPLLQDFRYSLLVSYLKPLNIENRTRFISWFYDADNPRFIAPYSCETSNLHRGHLCYFLCATENLHMGTNS